MFLIEIVSGNMTSYCCKINKLQPINVLKLCVIICNNAFWVFYLIFETNIHNFTVADDFKMMLNGLVDEQHASSSQKSSWLGFDPATFFLRGKISTTMPHTTSHNVDTNCKNMTQRGFVNWIRTGASDIRTETSTTLDLMSEVVFWFILYCC